VLVTGDAVARSRRPCLKGIGDILHYRFVDLLDGNLLKFRDTLGPAPVQILLGNEAATQPQP
jgi:hypothetical protein